jgi:peptidoglycan/LPS O-acetylase OafA/YrhL
MRTIPYRPDIDGLRAIAVTAVIAFHLSHAWLPGGYLGVDMFFVLSGYLITAIIWQEINAGTFTILRFYERRIRRIMPALLCVLVVTTVLSAVVLLPADFAGYGKSVLATLLFVANVYFWRDAGYFSRAAEEKPLLHVWSLSVEEQFYVVFPLVLVLVARYWKAGTLAVVAAGGVASLALNVIMLAADGATPAFFMLPTRAWELAAGAVLALLPATARPSSRIQAQASGIAGALLIGAGLLFTTSPYEVYPVALPVVMGTAMLIWAAAGGTGTASTVNSALAHPAPVFLGQISYSLYLWHWPVLVFVRYYLVRDLTIPEVALALALMLVLAWGSWRYVERPFRDRRFSISKVAGLTAGVAVLLAGAAVSMVVTQGWPSRLRPEAAAINRAIGTNYRCPILNFMPFGASRACAMNLPSRNPMDAEVVLFGNSHAQMYEPLVEDLVGQDQRPGLLVPLNGCLPTVKFNLSVACSQSAQLNFDQILKLPKLNTVMLGLTWGHDRETMFNGRGEPITSGHMAALTGALDEMISKIEQAGKRAILIGPIETPGGDLASTLSREIAFGWPPSRPIAAPRASFDSRFGTITRHFEQRMGPRFIRPDKILCDAERCHFVFEGRSLYADSSHLALAEIPRFKSLFRAALAAPAAPR